MRTFKVEDRNQDGAVELISETLTDGSKVYAVKINHDRTWKIIDCINEGAAVTLFDLLGNQSDYLF